MWALFGVARTGKDALRADGVRWRVPRRGGVRARRPPLRGDPRPVRVKCQRHAEVACDGFRLAAGATSVRQYVHQVLGMSADAFRASVCCEQKQVDAFSWRRPEERRRLVLDLLGITPIDRARDTARAKARAAAEAVEAARLVLGDLDALADEVAELEPPRATRPARSAPGRGPAAAAIQAATAAETAAQAAEAARLERDRLGPVGGGQPPAARTWPPAGRGTEAELHGLDEAAQRLANSNPGRPPWKRPAARLRALEMVEAARRRWPRPRGRRKPRTPR